MANRFGAEGSALVDTSEHHVLGCLLDLMFRAFHKNC